MGRKHFAFDNTGELTPNRKLRRGKVSAKPATTTISGPYVPSVNSTNRFVLVSDSNHWKGKSTSTDTPIFFSANGGEFSDLINLVNQLRREKRLSDISTLPQALEYCVEQNFIILLDDEVYSPVLDGLVFCIDAGFKCSYSSGTTVYDMAGNWNAALSGASKVGDAFYFRGQGEVDGDPTGDRIDLNSSALTTNPSSRPNGTTYEFWINTENTQTMSVLWGSGTINHLELRGLPNSAYWRTEAVTQNGYSFGSGGIPGGVPNGEWVQFIIVFDELSPSRDVRWYKNGDLFYTGNMSSGNNPTGEYFQPSSFGRATGSSAFLYANSFRGSMTRLAAWDRALSQDEIDSLYEINKVRHGH